MTRVVLDPMPMLRQRAIAHVNEHFNRRFHERAHLDFAHDHKRKVAAAVMAGEAIGGDHPFAKEAEQRDISLLDFAVLIASKPDNIAKREGDRQTLMAEIELAETPADLSDIINKIG